MYDIPFDRSFLQLSNGIRHVMPSTDRKLELTAKLSMAQPVSQPAVCSNGLTIPGQTLNSTHSWPWNYMEMNRQLPAAAALLSVNTTPWGRDSSVVVATRYGLDGPGIESRCGNEIFRTHPERPWGPPSLLYNGYRVFPGVKAAGAWRLPPTPSSVEVEEREKLYPYSASGPTWPVLGWPLPLYLTPPFPFINMMWVFVVRRASLDTGDKKNFCFCQAIIQQLEH